jgi:hypothetical protein
MRLLDSAADVLADDLAKHLVVARADVGYRELAERLKKCGLKETEASIANKISRGAFSATFLLASLKAIEADVVRLESV